MSRLLKNLLRGAASISLIPDPRDFDSLRARRPQPRNAEDAWRSDLEKIGADFKRVISRIDHEQKNSR